MADPLHAVLAHPIQTRVESLTSTGKPLRPQPPNARNFAGLQRYVPGSAMLIGAN